MPSCSTIAYYYLQVYNHAPFIMDKSLYPEEWQAIRNRILDRDNRQCRHCGKKDRSYVFIERPGNWLTVTKSEAQHLENGGYRVCRVYLQVAHLDNIKENISPENLISLCPPCHLVMDASHKVLVRLTRKK